MHCAINLPFSVSFKLIPFTIKKQKKFEKCHGDWELSGADTRAVYKWV